jgi:hypothetical protein
MDPPRQPESTCGTPALTVCGLARFEVTHVDSSRDDAPVETLDQIRCLVEVFRRCMRVAEVVDRPADVDGDDVGVLFSEPDGVTAALPAGCPTDVRDLALDATVMVSRPA